MYIRCPSCAAVYDVPAIMLTAARTMRCAGCGQDWQTEALDIETARLAMQAEARAAAPSSTPPGPPGSDATAPGPAPGQASAASTGLPFTPDDPDAPLPLPSAPPDDLADLQVSPVVPVRDARVSRIRNEWPALAGWVVSLAVMAAGGHATLAHAVAIAAAWPASRRLFQWLGVG